MNAMLQWKQPGLRGEMTDLKTGAEGALGRGRDASSCG